MRSIRKILICSLMMLTIVCGSVAVNANTSTLYVTTPGGNAYSSTSDYSQIVGSNHTYCYIHMNYFKFNGYGTDVFPTSGTRINARLYSYNPGNTPEMSAATEVAHYYSSPDGGSVAYYSGFGTVGTKYRLKTNSNYNSLYHAEFYWYS
ncbi:MAG: hypothetical protein IK020_04070 [Clostridiales bacterium]|nr:hypothetical protein [Clostridiales bacterium]